MNAIEQVVTETPAPQVANGDLSITQLIIDASPLVQGVMLFLLILHLYYCSAYHYF